MDTPIPTEPVTAVPNVEGQEMIAQNIGLSPVSDPIIQTGITDIPLPPKQSKFPFSKSQLILLGTVLLLGLTVLFSNIYAHNQTKLVITPTLQEETTPEPTALETPLVSPEASETPAPNRTSTPTPTPIPTRTPTPAPTSTPTPVSQNSLEVKIISLAYFPIKNGVLDTSIVNNNWGEYSMTLEQIRSKVASLNSDLASTLEDGTKYKGYKGSGAAPALRYTFYNKIELQEAIPASNKAYYNDNNLKLTDYNAVVTRQNICDLVNNKGVKEVWIWSYTGLTRAGWESNFSSSYGDISNSDRDNGDLPVCNKSYTVYEYNYGRGASEATEDHIHQDEAIFRFVNEDLFWNKFVGYFPGGNWASSTVQDQGRRCGWAHFPPNGERDYDWTNTNSVQSDCTNWTPDGSGAKESISCTKWGCNSKNYFVFWMQNIPGPGNNLTYNGAKLRNWWGFIGNFDEAMRLKKDLVY